MTTIAVLQTDLILNSAAFRSGMVQAAATANAALGGIQREAQKTSSAISLMSKAAMGFAGFEAIKEGVGALLEAQVQLQQIQFTLISATGSAQAAGDTFVWLQGEAQKLGLNLQPAAQAFGQLAASAQASNIPMSQTKALFEAYGQASTVLHLSTEQSNHALLALTEMMSRGTINARQLNQQLGFAIPGSAARFKNAVMDAVKGTDLAGESFAKLEKDGKLVTAQFMPELIQALTETGRGWEEAAGGLNAQMNRLKTAWFDLKNEVSGGLFNDAATSSISFMASNLGTIASSLGTIGVLAGTAFVGRQVTAGVDAATSKMASIRATQEQAAAALQLADAQAVETAAQIRNSEAALAGVTTARQQVLAARQAALAKTAQAEADLAAAQATLANLKAEEAYRTEIVFETEALARSAAAQVALTRATQEYDASLVATAALKDQQIALDTRLLELRAANTAAIEAQAVATEAQAASGLLATIGAGVASLGDSLLAMAGGPIGIVIAAIGTLGYEFLSARSSAQELTRATDDLAKSTQDVVLQAQDLVATYHEVGNTDPLAQLKDGEKTLGEMIDANRAKIKSQQDELVAMGTRGAGSLTIGGFDIGNIMGVRAAIAGYTFVVDKLSGKEKALADNTAALTEANSQLQASYDSEQSTLVEKYSSAWSHVGDSLHNMKFSIDGILGVLPQLGQEFQDAIKKAAGIDSARAAFTQMETEQESHIKSMEKTIAEHGKTQVQIVAMNQKKMAEQLATAGEKFSPEQVASNAQELKDAASIDAFKKKRTVVDKVKEAYDSLMKSMRDKVAVQDEELAGGSKATEADKNLIKVKEDLLTNLKTASPLQKQALLDEATHLVNLTNENIAAKAKLDNLQAEQVLKAKLADMAALQNQTQSRTIEGVGHGSQWNTEQKAVEALSDSYAKQRTELTKQFNEGKLGFTELAARIATVNAAYNDAAASQQKFFAEQKAAAADWNAGFSAGIEDFQTQQQNNAAHAKQMVTDLTSGFSTAFTSFVTGAASARTAFGGFIDDMYKKAIAFMADKVIQSFLDSFGIGNSPTAGSTAGGWQSLFGNFLNAYSGGSSGGAGGFFGSSFFGGEGSFFGGGLALGGPAMAGSVHPVAETGPEVLSVGGRQMLIMGNQSGHVTPLNDVKGGSAAPTYITNITVPQNSTRRSADQLAAANSREQRVATARNR